MQRGTKPKPKTLKVLKGVRPDRINHEEPEPTPGRPPCPDHLDDVARAEWERMIPILEDMRVLTLADGAALAQYCEAHSLAMRAKKHLAEEGEVLVRVSSGASYRNPWLETLFKTNKDIYRYLCEFGLTPSSRSRVKATNANEAASKWAGML